MTYDPASAIKNVWAGLKQTEPKPIGGLTDASGEVYSVKQRPETLAFFLLEWVSGASKMPPDIDALLSQVHRDQPMVAGKSPVASALRMHSRPDGGTYLGTYTSGHYGDDVVVYGDPLMEQQQIVQTVHAFRRFHAEQEAGMPVRTGIVS